MENRHRARSAQDAAPGPPRHLYVHVPFCRARCDYCAFYSEPLTAEAYLDAYVEALLAEWRCEQARWGIGRLETVYLGGGTPSLLGELRLQRLLEPLQPQLTQHAEVTIETNPEDVTPTYANWVAHWRPKPRVSLGVQSFSARLRRELGRRGDVDPAVAYRRLRDAGVTNLSVDLIFAIPGQGVAEIEEELRRIGELQPEHVSWYELDIPEGGALERRLRGRRAPSTDVDGSAELYRRLVHGLERLGYHWYEVSNFARSGHQARHNVAYWRGQSYLGLGPAAVSTVGELRWTNEPDVRSYLAWAGQPTAASSSPERQWEELDEVVRARERLMLAARTGAAVELAAVAPALDSAALEPLAEAGFILLSGGKLRVARKGRYVANEVCVRLFRDFAF